MSSGAELIEEIITEIKNRISSFDSFSPLFKAIRTNNLAEFKQHLNSNIYSFMNGLLYLAVASDSEKITTYILENESNHIEKKDTRYHPLEITFINETHKCLPVLLLYGYRPEHQFQKEMIAKLMREITPPTDSIEKMSKVMMSLSTILLLAQGVSSGVIGNENALEKSNLLIKSLPKTFFGEQFESHYLNILYGETFGNKEYYEINQLCYAATVFNWLVSAEPYESLYKVNINVVESLELYHERFKDLKSGSSISISDWGETINALSVMLKLVDILEQDNDNLTEKLEGLNTADLHLPTTDFQALIENDKTESINILKERIRALKWLSGFNPKYIHC